MSRADFLRSDGPISGLRLDAAQGLDPCAEWLWGVTRVDPAQTEHGYLVEDLREARRLAARYTQGYFLTPEGECFHNATVTGGKPSTKVLWR